MGFKKPNFTDAVTEIGRALTEIHSPYNDGFTASTVKKDLYILKCWLNDEYEKLPSFVGEKEWEKERLINLLKK